MIGNLIIGPLSLTGETRGGHVHVTVRGSGFAGHRPHVGTLTLGIAEWSALAAIAEIEDLARRQVEQDRLEINRLQVQRDQARAQASALATRYAPIASLIGDWDWHAIAREAARLSPLWFAAEALTKIIDASGAGE